MLPGGIIVSLIETAKTLYKQARCHHYWEYDELFSTHDDDIEVCRKCWSRRRLTA